MIVLHGAGDKTDSGGVLPPVVYLDGREIAEDFRNCFSAGPVVRQLSVQPSKAIRRIFRLDGAPCGVEGVTNQAEDKKNKSPFRVNREVSRSWNYRVDVVLVGCQRLVEAFCLRCQGDRGA